MATQSISERLAAANAAKLKALNKVATAAERTFYGEFGQWANFVTPAGTQVTFYRGYCTTNNLDAIQYLANLDGVVEVTDIEGLKVPQPPVRQRSRNLVGRDLEEATTFSPMELLQRAVASSANTPQASASNSQTAN